MENDDKQDDCSAKRPTFGYRTQPSQSQVDLNRRRREESSMTTEGNGVDSYTATSSCSTTAMSQICSLTSEKEDI